MMPRQPIYEKVLNSIKAKIIDGEYETGELLPPEPALEKEYSVSRTTIRKAVEVLVRDGYVKVKQGKGTEVLDYVTMQKLNKVTSFSKTLLDKGHTVKPKTIYIDTTEATVSVAKGLKVKEGTEVVRVQRVQLSNDKPIAIITNYLTKEVGGCLLTNNVDFVSLYQFIEEQSGISIDSSNDRISAKSADFAEAQMLEVPVKTALIYLKRVCYAQGKPISVDILKVVGDKYEFVVNLLGRDE